MFSCTTQHIYCTNCTVWNWTVLTVITQKLLLHVQLHNSTAHLLYKYCTNCTVCNWTVLTVITHKLVLHVQLHNRRETVSWCLQKCIAASCLIMYVYRKTFTSSDQIIQTNSHDKKRTTTTSLRYKTNAQLLIRRLPGGFRRQPIPYDGMT